MNLHLKKYDVNYNITQSFIDILIVSFPLRSIIYDPVFVNLDYNIFPLSVT